MAPTILDRLMGYILPGILIFASAACFIYAAITAPQLIVTDIKSFRNRAFATMWLIVGKKFSKDTPKAVDQMLANARGVILDVGPGAGDQLFRFSQPQNIEMIYGAEPGVDLHAALRRNAEKAKLGEKYKVLTCGAEPESLVPALAKERLLGKENSFANGIFDEIICIRVLCGVPKLQETIQTLYKCLKPGGRLVVLEHVINDDHKPGSVVSKFFQHLYMALGWPFWAGGCELTRDTTAVLMKAAEVDGGWSEVKLEKLDEWSVIPHVVGYCTKKS